MIKTLVEKELSSVKRLTWELSVGLFTLIWLFYAFVISDTMPKEVGGVLLCVLFCWHKIFVYQVAKVFKGSVVENKSN